MDVGTDGNLSQSGMRRDNAPGEFFLAGKKKGKERYLVPVPDGKRVRFEIAGPNGVPREGTVSRTQTSGSQWS